MSATATTTKPQYRSDSIKLSRFTLENTASGLILPNEELTTSGLLAVHQQYPDRKILVLDNNPFNGCSRQEMLTFLGDNKEWIRVVDHHGLFNDGQRVSTFPRLLNEFDELNRHGFLGNDTLAVTNFGNLDPDGIFSFFAVAHPQKALEHKELLTDAACFTDFACFGGINITENLSSKDFSKPELLGLALFQLITEEKEKLVENIYQTPVTELSRDQIRRIFVAEDDHKAEFNDRAVQKIYCNIINEQLCGLLNRPLAVEKLAELAIERLKTANKEAEKSTLTWGENDHFPGGRVAYMSKETGFNSRLDNPYPVYDWLVESAGQHCSNAPIHIREYKGFTIISVRFPKPDEQQNHEFSVAPLIPILNEISGKPTFYGRREVVLGPALVEIPKILKIIDSNWDELAKPL